MPERWAANKAASEAAATKVHVQVRHNISSPMRSAKHTSLNDTTFKHTILSSFCQRMTGSHILRPPIVTLNVSATGC